MPHPEQPFSAETIMTVSGYISHQSLIQLKKHLSTTWSTIINIATNASSHVGEIDHEVVAHTAEDVVDIVGAHRGALRPRVIIKSWLHCVSGAADPHIHKTAKLILEHTQQNFEHYKQALYDHLEPADADTEIELCLYLRTSPEIDL